VKAVPHSSWLVQCCEQTRLHCPLDYWNHCYSIVYIFSVGLLILRLKLIVLVYTPDIDLCHLWFPTTVNNLKPVHIYPAPDRGWAIVFNCFLYLFLVCFFVSTRDVNFREFYFSIREFQISRLVEYSKLTRHLAWTMHLMRECCNTVDITLRSCGWAAAPGKWSDGREAVAVSNYEARLSLSWIIWR